METITPAEIAATQDQTRAAAEQLSDLFGSYKAEWLREKIYDLFAEPDYFPELKTPRPCVLVGGRGTGKTTVLRCLSYEGQFALHSGNDDQIPEWPFYGFYYRVNTNRVMAFTGPELTEGEWTKYFAHYVNLELCDLALRFLEWYGLHRPSDPTLTAEACKRIAISLNIKGVDSMPSLIEGLVDARLRFEAHLNSAADREVVVDLSLQGGPIDALFREISALGQFASKNFFYLIDEYENLTDYQQQIFNTLIKHCGERYSFKIGVKELGFRMRSTLNTHEQLISPADYVLVDISEKLGDRFSDFAAAVCNDRLRKVDLPGMAAMQDVRGLFGQLSEEEEADRLEVRDRVAEIRSRIARELSAEELTVFDGLRPLEAYFMAYWASSQEIAVPAALQEYLRDRDKWYTRFENHSFASMFTLRRGKRGIHKYYAGWDVYVQLAAGNIRYLLELVEQSLLRQLRSNQALGATVSFEIQTDAAQAVGKKNLTELDGLSVSGAKLTRLLLGLGRIFQVMAAQPEGHTPEANQFAPRIEEGYTGDERVNKVEGLLRDAVMHLALIRFSGNKLQDPSEVRSFDYMVHPIFSAFFEFSYRRKRKIVLTVDDIIGLVDAHRRAIPEILRRQNRSEKEVLPPQLRLFGEFYAGSK